MIATIRPRRIELYINTAKKTLAQIKAETGASHIINGGSFTSFSRPDIQLKADGKVYVNDGYTYWGYAWDDASDFGLCVLPCDKANYIALICMLRNGQNEPMNIKPAYGGCRQRTAIGTKSDGSIVLYCTQSGRYPEQVRDEMKAAGCIDAVLLDSGGSSQCDFDGWVLKSDRVVHNLLLFWADDLSDGGDIVATLKKGSKGESVKSLQNQLILCGANITADGDFGSKTDAAVKSFQRDMQLTADGIVGSQTQTALDMAVTWRTSGNALVTKAGPYLGISEPDGDNAIIDAFNALAGANYGHSDSWCQMFAVVCMDAAGLEPFVTASCTLAYNHYQAAGTAEALPAVGRLIYFDWDRSGDCDHVGIVSAVGNGYVYVIEGNSAGNGYDAVRIKRYLATDTRIRGYADVTPAPVAPPSEESAYDWAVRNGWISSKFKPGDMITVELLCAVLKRLKGNS